MIHLSLEYKLTNEPTKKRLQEAFRTFAESS